MQGFRIEIVRENGGMLTAFKENFTLEQAKGYAELVSRQVSGMTHYKIWGYSERDRFYTRLLFSSKDISRSLPTKTL